MYETKIQVALDSLISAASAHGDREGNDAHIEMLESLLVVSCSMMTEEQWLVFINGAACTDILQRYWWVGGHSGLILGAV